jgi:type II secretory pathway component GspD/PulD (secretin)
MRLPAPRPRWALAAVVVFLSGWVILLGRTAADTAPPAAQKREYRSYRLKYARAVEAARLVRLLLSAPDGRTSGLTMAADERTNSVLVRAPESVHAEVEALLVKIDVPAEPGAAAEPVLKTFTLKQAAADGALERALGVLLKDRPLTRFTVLRDNRVVLVYGDPETILKVAELLTQLEDAAAAHPAPVVNRVERPSGTADLQVRLFWVVSGAPREGAGTLPDKLDPIVGELRGLGIERPRVAAAFSLTTAAQSRFETSGHTSPEAAYRLSLTGTVSGAAGESALEITVTRDGPRRRSGSVCGLRTRLRLPLDQPVVVGSAPAGTLKTAFVVEVRHPPAAAARKTVAMEIKNKPWKQVLEWLADSTEIPVIASHPPAGTFTFSPPRAGQRFTIPDVIDILNEGLADKHYLLVRRNRAISLIDADQSREPDVRASLSLPIEQLAEHGRTELAQVIIPLRRLVAADVAPELKKMLGRHAEVAALPSANELVLLDTVGNIRRIYSLIQELERGANHDGKGGQRPPKDSPRKRAQ